MAMSIPSISISLAPPEDELVEPYSPFSKTSFQLTQHDDDAFRPVHLTPPPTHTSFSRRSLSPNSSPSEEHSAKPTGRGLDRARFEALLKVSQEKPPMSVKRDIDLRKEVALKAHRNKQIERRALFLSKVLAPPSPTAATLPPTPPDSPAVFHYRLPSPGLISPIDHYESLQEDEGANSCSPWVEQVDFKIKLLAPPVKPRRRTALQPKHAGGGKQVLPSLDQISARLNNYRSIRMNEATEAPTQPAPVQVIGRLRMPVRAPKTLPLITVTDDSVPAPVITVSPVEEGAPGVPHLTSPWKPTGPKATLPTPQSISPTEVPRINPPALESRESRSSAMLSTLRRRTQSDAVYGIQPRSATDIEFAKPNRRHSAPPDSMPQRGRKGFEHPILALPGAF